MSTGRLESARWVLPYRPMELDPLIRKGNVVSAAENALAGAGTF
jgi:hypothetical protein